MNLDVAKEVLLDYILSATVYRCKVCRAEFFTVELETAKLCPFCTGEVFVDEKRRVEIIDFE